MVLVRCSGAIVLWLLQLETATVLVVVLQCTLPHCCLPNPLPDYAGRSAPNAPHSPKPTRACPSINRLRPRLVRA